jgi:hypothetical protein
VGLEKDQGGTERSVLIVRVIIFGLSQQEIYVVVCIARMGERRVVRKVWLGNLNVRHHLEQLELI